MRMLRAAMSFPILLTGSLTLAKLTIWSGLFSTSSTAGGVGSGVVQVQAPLLCLPGAKLPLRERSSFWVLGRLDCTAVADVVERDVLDIG
jgi:hypothetical protein